MSLLLIIFFVLVVVLALLLLVRSRASKRAARARAHGGCLGGWGDEDPGSESEGAEGSDEEGFLGGGAFRLKVADPWYEAMLEGKKAVEGRLDRGPFSRLKTGDPVVVIRSRPRGDTSEYTKGPYKYSTEVARITKYPNYSALVKSEGAEKLYPGKKTAEAAVDEFKKHLRDPADLAAPAVAIELKPPSKGKK